MSAKSGNQKKERLQGSERAIVPVLVERVLLEYSDAGHDLSVTDIRKHLEEDYGVSCAPKGKLIQNSLEGLAAKYKGHELMDLDIAKGESRNSKWRVKLDSRDFDREEIAYLISLCYSSHAGQNRRLVEKLVSLLSESERKGLTDPYEKAVAGQKKSLAETLYEVGIAQEAIDYNVGLFTEDEDGNMPPHEDGRTVNFRYPSNKDSESGFIEYCGLFPLRVKIVDGYCYLACARPKKNNGNSMRPGIMPIRLDLTENLEWETLIGPFPENYMDCRYQADRFLSNGVDRMFPHSEKEIALVTIKIKGEEKRVKQAERYVKARFSDNEEFTELHHEADGFPKYRFMVFGDGFKLWVLKWLDCIEVQRPDSLRQDIMGLIESNAYGNFAEEASADD